MPSQAKNMLIGIFVFAACATVVFILMFLHPSVGDEGLLVHVRFANIDKISVGTRVTFAGKPIGEVIAITELADSTTERKSVNGFVYVYELTLKIDSSTTIFNTDSITARTSGLLGEKSVAIIPGPVKAHEELRSINHEIIYAMESGGVEDTLKEFKELEEKVEKVLDSVIDALTILKENKFWEDLTQTADKITGIATHFDHAFSALEKNHFWESIGQSVQHIHEFTTVLNNKEQWSNTFSNVHKITGSVDLMLEKVKRGEGSLGQLINGDEVYLRVNSMLNKVEVVMNDINHYGLLFHLDKGWQRLRARRMNLLQKLATPQQFRNYFNDEIDLITTSLERVSMILEQVNGQSAYGCFDLLQNGEFTKVYAELLRRISTLEEETRLYNQQVVNPAVYHTEFNNCESKVR